MGAVSTHRKGLCIHILTTYCTSLFALTKYMSLLKTLKNSFYFGVIPKISTLINVVLLPIITPYLAPYDYGIWGVISSYSSFILALVPLGLNMHLSNSFFEYKQWKLIWGRILFLFFLSGTIGSILLIGILTLELKDFTYGMRLLIGICSSIPILLFGNGIIAAHLYPLLESPKPLVFRNLTGSICSILISFIAIYQFRLGFWGFILGSMISAMVTFILFIPPIYIKQNIKPTLDRNIKRIKEWIKIASPVIPHTLGFMLLSSSSRIIMSWYRVPIEDIGIYSNGYMMGDYITIISTSLATALLPYIQSAYRNENFGNYRKMYYLCQIIVLSAVFSVSIWMSEIYQLLIRNVAFNDSIQVASYICYANVMMPLYTFISSICFIDKKTPQLLWLVFLPGVINISICLIFIPVYGYKVAVYSVLIAFWSQLLVPFISKYHKHKVNQWLGSRWKLVALLFIMVCAVCLSHYLNEIGILYKIVCTLSLITIVFLIIKQKKWDQAVARI